MPSKNNSGDVSKQTDVDNQSAEKDAPNNPSRSLGFFGKFLESSSTSSTSLDLNAPQVNSVLQ